MKRICYSLAVLLLSSLTICSCETGEGDGPDVAGNYEMAANKMQFGSKVVNVRAAVGGNYFNRMNTEYIYVAATNISGTSSDDIQKEDTYMYMLVDKSLVGREINLRSETSGFTVTVVNDGGEVFSCTNFDVTYGTVKIQSGTAKVTQTGDNKYDFQFVCVYEGATYAMRVEREMTEVERDELNFNSIFFGNSGTANKGPAGIWSAYYDDSASGSEILWFAAASFNDLAELKTKATYYFKIQVPSDYVDGREITLSGTSDKEGVSVVVYDNFEVDNDDNSIEYNAVDGTLTVEKDGDSNYIVYLSGTVYSAKTVAHSGSAKVLVDFSGECTSASYKYIRANEYTYNGVTRGVNTAFLEKQTDSSQWTIYLSELADVSLDDVKEEPLTVIISAPSAAFNTENPVGFSVVRNNKLLMTFACGNDFYTTDTYDDSGTLFAQLDENNGTIAVEVSNVGHNNIPLATTLKLWYEGPVTIVGQTEENNDKEDKE